MKVMSTYGALCPKPNQAETYRKADDGSTVFFKYAEVFGNHYQYRHIVDDFNNNRHRVPSIEGTWITLRWATRVFAFILACAEVNAFMAFKFFIWAKNPSVEPLTLIDFRRRLAKQLIHNEFLKKEKADKKRQMGVDIGSDSEDELGSPAKRAKSRAFLFLDHEDRDAPLHARAFVPGKGWDLSCKQAYQQHKCKAQGCQKKVRKYCSCAPGHWLCTAHLKVHQFECLSNNNL